MTPMTDLVSANVLIHLSQIPDCSVQDLVQVAMSSKGMWRTYMDLPSLVSLGFDNSMVIKLWRRIVRSPQSAMRRLVFEAAAIAARMLEPPHTSCFCDFPISSSSFSRDEVRQYLDDAISMGHMDIVALLIEQNVDAAEETLLKAVRERRADVVCKVLPLFHHHLNESASLMAAKNGDIDIIRALIRCSQDLDPEAPKGATLNRHVDILRLLLRHSVENDVDMNFAGAISVARYRGYNDVLDIFAEYGMYPDDDSTEDIQFTFTDDDSTEDFQFTIADDDSTEDFSL